MICRGLLRADKHTDGAVLPPLRAVLFVVIMALIVAGCAGGPPRQTENICAVFSQKFGWQRAALQQQAKWNVPMFISMAIMAQESAFRATATPRRKVHLGILPGKPVSSAYGYAQAIDGTWNHYRKDTGDRWRRRDSFVDALDFINWYITRTKARNGIDTSDVYRHYLNYHEGWHGYQKGSYQRKQWLIDTARRVAARAERYKSQYQSCS